jgi:hypothetical protein
MSATVIPTRVTVQYVCITTNFKLLTSPRAQDRMGLRTVNSGTRVIELWVFVLLNELEQFNLNVARRESRPDHWPGSKVLGLLL